MSRYTDKRKTYDIMEEMRIRMRFVTSIQQLKELIQSSIKRRANRFATTDDLCDEEIKVTYAQKKSATELEDENSDLMKAD